MLRPKILDAFKNYTSEKFLKDFFAGIIVAIIALPLAIAFGIGSGVKPEQGLITAVIAGLLISLLSGSRVQIGGPTGAFVIIIAQIINQHGYPFLLLATFLAGVILILMGLLRLGSIIKFIPHSVIIGFTSGIAFVIALSQLKDLTANFWSLLLGIITILLTVLWPSRFKIPGSLLAIIGCSALAIVFNLPVETIGSKFGELSAHIRAPQLPNFDLALVGLALKPAFTIAMLAAIESLLSAVVADGMIGGRHRSNMELVAQGFANIGTSLFGGIPATGAIARTAANIKNGGRTPVAGIVHAITLFLIMLFLIKWAVLIPLASLAGILLVVAYNMSEWRSARSIIKTSPLFAIVLITTFMLTVTVNLTVAIEVGLILASVIFIREMTIHTNVSHIDDDNAPDILREEFEGKLPEGVLVYEINGPMFFGAAYKFKEAIAEISLIPKTLILRMSHVPMIDSTGMEMLNEAFHRFAKKNTKFILVGVQPQVKKILTNSGLLKNKNKIILVKTFREALKK